MARKSKHSRLSRGVPTTFRSLAGSPAVLPGDRATDARSTAYSLGRHPSFVPETAQQDGSSATRQQRGVDGRGRNMSSQPPPDGNRNPCFGGGKTDATGVAASKRTRRDNSGGESRSFRGFFPQVVAVRGVRNFANLVGKAAPAKAANLSRFHYHSFAVNGISHLGIGRCAWISSFTPSHASA